METLIRVENVSKEYALGGALSRQRKVLALKGIDFALANSEIVGVLGESACGKTTLAKIMLGAEKPTQGKVVYHPSLKVPPQVQMVFQDPFSSLSPNYRILTLLREVLELKHKRQKAGEIAIRLLQEVGLKPEIGQRFAHQLSGGQIQRVAFARALAASAKVIIADEPTSSLDVIAALELRKLILRLKEKGISFVVISHNLLELVNLASRVLVIYQGRIVEVAKAKEIIESPKHPYTQLLACSAKRQEEKVKEFFAQGEEAEEACCFFSRCPFKKPLCRRQPPLFSYDGGKVACWLYQA